MRKINEFYGFFRTGHRIIFCLLMGQAACFADNSALFNYAEYKLASTFTLPCDSEKEKSFSADTGLKLSFRDAEFRGYVNLPKTGFGTFGAAEGLSEKLDLLDEPRLGAGIYLFKNTLPVTMKIGHNSYSKSISKMKNPSPPVTANPLTKSFAFSTGTGAGLPTLTGSCQPLSCSLGAVTSEKLFPIQFALEGFINDEEEGAAFFSARYQFSRSLLIQSAFSLGRFYIENNSTILKKNNIAFEPDYFYSALGEFCFHSPLLKVNLYAGLQESPYEVNPFWLRLDGRTSLSFFMLNFSYFAIPTTKDSPKALPLIGGSSSICRIVEQASVNPQLLFLFDDKNASSIRLGFSALENWKVTATNTPVQLNTAKVRLGASYENSFFTMRLDWTRANILLSGTPPTKSSTPEEYQSFGFSSSLAGKVAKISLSASYANYPPVTESSSLKEIYSADLKIALPKVSLAAQTGFDFTMKDGNPYTRELNLGATYAFKRKYFRSSVRISLIMPF